MWTHEGWAAGVRRAGLTVIVNEEGGVGREDLVVADLAVLGGAVTVNGFHAQDAVIQLPLGHCSTVQPLHKHRGKLVHVVDPHVHSRPARAREGGGERTSQPALPLTLNRGTCRNSDKESEQERRRLSLSLRHRCTHPHPPGHHALQGMGPSRELC